MSGIFIPVVVSKMTEEEVKQRYNDEKLIFDLNIVEECDHLDKVLNGFVGGDCWALTLSKEWSCADVIFNKYNQKGKGIRDEILDNVVCNEILNGNGMLRGYLTRYFKSSSYSFLNIYMLQHNSWLVQCVYDHESKRASLTFAKCRMIDYVEK